MPPTDTDTDSDSATDTDVSEKPMEIVVDIKPGALETVLGIRAEEDDAENLRLRIEVTGSKGVDYTYDLAFETESEGKEGDIIYQVGELTVVVPPESILKLAGSELDLPGNPMQGGLVLRNPNRPNPLDGKQLELTGDLPEKIRQLLDQSINPNLASHGGFVTLIGVEDDKVFLSMGGGCQGCSMSAATMVEGVSVALKETFPEITEVVDVTDHTAGENPYFD